MSLWRQLRQGAFVLMRRAAADRELEEEVQHYFDQHVTALVNSGLSDAEARRITRLRLGEPAHVREVVRAGGWENALSSAYLDLRYAARRLRKNPGFTIVTVLTLALGIGAATTVFSAVRPILLEPLPYPDANRLVMVWDRAADGSRLDVTFGTYRELVERSRSFESLATMRSWQPVLTGPAEPERLDAQRVSAGFLRTLGVPPALGRDFADAEDQVNGPPVVIVSHRLWQRVFNGDRTAVGRQITLNDRAYTVIGVMPSSFENVLSPSAELWVPLQYDASLPPDGREWGHHLRLAGRLRRGVGVDESTQDLLRIAEAPVREFPRVPWAALNQGLLVNPLQSDVTGDVRPALFAIIGAVVLLLGIACVNVASLLLAQGVHRRGEMALRAALGAGRTRLVSQLVVEGVLLAFIGAAAGIAVARLGIQGLVSISPPELPLLGAIRLDRTVLAFGSALTATIGVAVGVFIAMQHTRSNARGVQQHSGRVAGTRSTTRRLLVVVEVALAVVLLITGGLLLRSMERLLSVDPGFVPAQVVTMRVQASTDRFRDDAALQQFFAQSLDAVRAVPGVAAADFTSQLPLTGMYMKYGVQLESGAAASADEDGSALRYAVSPGYLATMGIPVRSGRPLDAGDAGAATGAVLISESLARRSFRDADPIGQRLRLGSSDQPWSVVVGVVGDVRQQSLAAGEENAVYLPTARAPSDDRVLWLVARTRGDAGALAPAIRQAIWSVDRNQSVSDVATMASRVERSAAERRFTLIVIQTFALAALLLAAVGLYGILAGSVAERVREIGVRSALGATRVNIVRLIVGQGLALTGAGLVLGLTAAILSSRVASSLLFGVSHLDGVTYAGTLLVLVAVAGAASVLPAWRAVRIDPAITLRAD